jgi:hypothetical protein
MDVTGPIPLIEGERDVSTRNRAGISGLHFDRRFVRFVAVLYHPENLW